MILGGRLSEAGTGRQLLARAKDEPSLSVFVLSTNTAILIFERDTFRAGRKGRRFISDAYTWRLLSSDHLTKPSFPWFPMET